MNIASNTSPVRSVCILLLTLLLLPIPRNARGAEVTAAPAGSAAGQAAYRFAIPEGPLDAAIAAFEGVTGLKITVPQGLVLAAFTSPGVFGTHTAEQALERLLAGTALKFRAGAAGTYAVDIAISPEQVDVTGRLIPYRVEEASTATKTATPLRDIPQTVTVVPRQLLVDQGAQSIADAMRNVPGVSVAQGEGNRDQIVLRGINTNADFFVNGVRDDQERFRDLYNVQNVEVVQGPAAVLFGRGGAGGVVNLVTKSPMRGAPSEASLELGSYERRRGTAQLEAPLGAKGSVRLSAMGEDSGGFRDGYFLHRYGVNPSVRIDASSATTMTFGFERLYDRRIADRGIPSQAGRPVDVEPQQFFGSIEQNESRNEVTSGYATLEHRLTDRLRLRNSLLIGRYEKFYQNVYPGTAVNTAGTLTLAAYNNAIDRTNAFNQTDLVYTADWGGITHTLLSGIELGHQFQDALRQNAPNVTNVSVSNSVQNANFAAATTATDRHASSDIFAAYVQDQLTLSSHWKAVVGVRADRFAVDVDDHLPGARDLARTDTPLSPRAGVIYQPSDTTSIYSSYSYTFLPSGETLGLAVNTVELEPENAKNYEVGAKLDLLERRLSVAAAVFRLDRNNVKNTDPNDPTRLVLTGQQRTEGVTFSAAGSLTSRWRLYGGYAYLNARITSATSAAPAGRRVGLVPRSQLNLWSTIDVTKRWGGGGGLVDQSKLYTSFSNQVELPRFTRVDGLVYYRIGRSRIALNVENLFNVDYYPTAHSDNNISTGSPRAARVTLSTLF